MFEIIYNNNSIVNKNFLSKTETNNPPDVTLALNNNDLYTLIMFDPDTKFGDYIHWLLINITLKGNIKYGDIIIPYKGPAPPINTGIHRYIFLLFKQATFINPNNFKNLNRVMSLQDLLKSLDLKSNPIYTNYFTSKY